MYFYLFFENFRHVLQCISIVSRHAHTFQRVRSSGDDVKDRLPSGFWSVLGTPEYVVSPHLWWPEQTTHLKHDPQGLYRMWAQYISIVSIITQPLLMWGPHEITGVKWPEMHTQHLQGLPWYCILHSGSEGSINPGACCLVPRRLWADSRPTHPGVMDSKPVKCWVWLKRPSATPQESSPGFWKNHWCLSELLISQLNSDWQSMERLLPRVIFQAGWAGQHVSAQ